MVDYMLPWSKPTIGEEEYQAVSRVMKSGWVTQGKETELFEKELGSYIGNKKLVVVNNGTSALMAALIAHGVKHGDEVIVPGNTFIATINSVIALGAKPVLCDCDLDTWNITPELVEPLITKKTKIIMPVDVSGTPCDYDGFIYLAKKYGLSVIFDSAESMGARYKHKRPGDKRFDATFIYSFHMAKQISMIEGGVVVCPNSDLSCRIRLIRNHGMENSNYKFTELGLNLRTNDLQSAIGRVQLTKLNKALVQRKILMGIYKKKLSKSFTFQKIIEGTSSANLLAAVMIDQRTSVIHKLKRSGVPFRICWPYIGSQPYHKKLVKKSLPNCSELSRKIIALPLGNGMSSDDVERVCCVLE